MTQELLQQITGSTLTAMERAVRAYEADRFLADEYLAARGIAPEVAASFRLGCVEFPEPGHEKYQGRLAIPYLGLAKTGEEQVWAIRFRALAEGSGPKYMTVQGEASRMFNAKAIKYATDEIHVAEGEFDAMILNQCGLPAVAFPGVNNYKSHHRRVLAGFDRVFLWGDPDDAGQDFNTRLQKDLGSWSRRVHLRDGDVNETYLLGGREAVLKHYEGAR